jgi:hypothetical protein
MNRQQLTADIQSKVNRKVAEALKNNMEYIANNNRIRDISNQILNASEEGRKALLEERRVIMAKQTTIVRGLFNTVTTEVLNENK